ncbi:MAG: phosphate ABC transporter permease PstA [Gammaproteobacteria bacterium]|nr:phosphate ABC transporter permease PstA [Gammaproteobacteria bacterium]
MSSDAARAPGGRSPASERASPRTIDIVTATLARRHSAERRFRLYGLGAIILGLVFLAVLFVSVIGTGYRAFLRTEVALDVPFDPAALALEERRDPEALAAADYGAAVKQALRDAFPEVRERQALRALYGLVSSAAALQLRDAALKDPSVIGQTRTLWVPLDDEYDMLAKGYVDRELPEGERRLSDAQVGWFDHLQARGRVATRFNGQFFIGGDSREPELAGIGGAVVGSLYTLLVTLALSFPLGVAAAIYLEELAPKNRWTDLIEVNINNLAAVPSIIFGLLGLAVFIDVFGVPRSAPLVGGLVLTLMTLPVIIIASRAALTAVPPSIREAALGVGASKMQMVMHHVLPLAMPGMLTGAIIGMARALGESAPLLMVGMVAFIVDIPRGVMDPATVLPVQIYLWADSPERAFVEKMAAAIMVLLAFLIVMNALAVILRRRFERRW